MKNHNRRDFIKQVSATGAVLATGAFVSVSYTHLTLPTKLEV